MHTQRSVAIGLLFLVSIGLLLATCTGERERPVAGIFPNELPGIPDDAVHRAFGSDGGEVAMDDVRVRLEPGEVVGEVEIALIPRPPQIEYFDDWSDRIQPLGEPFSLALRGPGAVQGGTLEIDFDQAAVPDGWTVQLLRHTPEPVLAEQPGWASDQSAARTLVANETDMMRMGTAGGQKSQSSWRYLNLSCSAAVERARLRADFNEFGGYDEDVLQLVMTRDLVPHRYADSADRPWLCIYLVEPPAHGAESYLERLRAGLFRARDTAQRLGFRLPGYPVVVTVRSELFVSNEGIDYGHVIGNHIAVDQNLHVYPPLTAPGRLERVAAKLYFHALQSNAMNRSTLRLFIPNNGWALAGSAEWFVHQVYPGIDDEIRPGRAVEPLFSLGKGAFPFWAHLESTVAPGITKELLETTRRQGMQQLFGSRDLPAGQIVHRAPYYHILAQVLDSLLEARDSSLSAAYASFAREYLLNLQQEADPDIVKNPVLGLHDEWPLYWPWNQRSVSGTNATYPLKHGFSQDELSAGAVRLVSPTDRARLTLTASNFRSPWVTDGPFDFNISVYGLSGKSGKVQELYSRARVSKQTTVEESYPDFSSQGINVPVGWASGPELKALYLVAANTSWTRWQSSGTDPNGRTLEAVNKIGSAAFDYQAFMSGRKVTRAPFSRPSGVSGSGTEVCVSRSELSGKKKCLGSIQEAIDNKDTKPGDTILVYPGTYDEQVTVTKPGLVIRAVMPGQALIRAAGPAVNIAVGDTYVGNFVIQGGNLASAAVRMPDVTDSSLVSNVIIASYGEGVTAFGGSNNAIEYNWVLAKYQAIRSNSPGIAVIGNVIVPRTLRQDIREMNITQTAVELPGDPKDTERSVHEGISVDPAMGAKIYGNFVTGRQRGIAIGRATGAEIKNNHVMVGIAGITAYEGDSVDISGNSSYGQYIPLNIQDIRAVTIEDNVVEGGNLGVSLKSIQDAGLRDNVFVGGDTYALTLEEVGKARLDSLLVDGTAKNRDSLSPPNGGIAVRNSTTVEIEDSTIIGGWHGISMAGGGDGHRLANLTVHQLQAREVQNKAAALLLNETHVDTEDLRLRGAHRGLHARSSTPNPDVLTYFEFKDLDFRDYRLRYALTAEGADLSINGISWWWSDRSEFVPLELLDSFVRAQNVQVGQPNKSPAAVFKEISSWGERPDSGDASARHALKQLSGGPVLADEQFAADVTPRVPFEWFSPPNFDAELDDGQSPFPLTLSDGSRLWIDERRGSNPPQKYLAFYVRRDESTTGKKGELIER